MSHTRVRTRALITPMARRYPYIYAWAAFYELIANGHRPAPALVQRLAERAAAEQLPDDVAWMVEWCHVGKLDRRTIDRAAVAGTVLIVRDDDGEPVRVWYRYTHLIPGSRAYDAVTRYADNLKRGLPGDG